jgi:hypothetical protein
MSLQEIIDTGKALGPSQIRTADVAFTFRSVQDILAVKEAQAGSQILARGFGGLNFTHVISNPRMTNTTPTSNKSAHDWGPQNGAWGCW